MSAASAENGSRQSSAESSFDESGEDKVRCNSYGLKLMDSVFIFSTPMHCFKTFVQCDDTLGDLFPTTWLHNEKNTLLYRRGLKSPGGAELG